MVVVTHHFLNLFFFLFPTLLVPGAIQSLEISPRTDALLITWLPPLDTPCPIVGYNLTFARTKLLACGEEGLGVTAETVITTPSTNHTLTRPSPYSVYWVSVRALTSATTAGEDTSEYAQTSEASKESFDSTVVC